MKERKKNPASTLLAIALGLAVICLLFIAVFTTILILNSSGRGAEEGLLSAGMGIIGIAIAIWAALNITNAINRQEIENLSDEVSDLENKMDPIDKFVKDNKGVQKELFLQELNKCNDPISKQFKSDFKIIEDNLPYSELTIIELKYSQVRAKHKSGYKVDRYLLDIAKDCIELINEIDEPEIPQKVRQYLLYRKAGFMFYQGYCTETKRDGVKYFLEAVENYKETAKALGIDLQKDCNENKLLECAALCNSIGESYSKVVHYYNDDENVRKDGEIEKKIEEYAKEAVKYLEKAVGCEEKIKIFAGSIIYRNLGCAYERKEMLAHVRNGKSAVKEDEKDKVIETFKKALKCAVKYSSSEYDTVKNAYHTTLSYYSKYLTQTVTSGKTIRFTDMTPDILRVNATADETGQAIKEIKDMYVLARDAVNAMPTSLEILWLYGMACCFAAMSKWNKNCECPIADDDSKTFYLQKARETAKKLRAYAIKKEDTKEDKKEDKREDKKTDINEKFAETIEQICDYISEDECT